MPLRHLGMPRQPRLRLGVAEQRVDLGDGGIFVACGRPDTAEPLAESSHGRELGAVMVAPPGPAEAVQIGVELCKLAEPLTVYPIGIDQDTRGFQGELGVISKNHLTHDLSSDYCH